MRNLFDFSDAQMSWRSCPGFIFNNIAQAENINEACNDEEDWFFPQPSIDVPEQIPNRFDREQKPALPPVIYISGMDLNCKIFENVPFNLADYESWEDFLQAVDRHMYVSIVDADNCDYELALEVFSSEEIFNQIVDEYKACL